MPKVLSDIRNGKKLIKRFFLVDYENVQSHGLVGLSKLTDTDAVTVYFSKNADTMSFELHIALNDCRAKVDFQKVGTGVKNALDFQLSSQLGYIINQNIVANNKNVRYYIISGDNGFSCLSQFWKQFDAEVEIVRSINFAVDPPKRGEYANVLAAFNISEEDEAVVFECISKSRTNYDLHNTLQQRMSSPQLATEIYRAVKPVFIESLKKISEEEDILTTNQSRKSSD